MAIAAHHVKHIRHILTPGGSQPRLCVCLLVYYGFEMLWNVLNVLTRYASISKSLSLMYVVLRMQIQLFCLI